MAIQHLDAELGALRDVEGVVGSFVLGASGSLLGRDLPAVFDTQTLGSVGLRVGRLLDALRDGSDAETHLTLRYAEHKLHLHRSAQTILGVITAPEASTPAMTMAMTLVGRRIARALASQERRAPPAAPTLPAVPRPQAPARPADGTLDGPRPSTQYGLSPRPAAETPAPPHLPPAQPPGAAPPPGAPGGPARPRYFRGRRVE